VIYYLANTKRKLIYIGKAEDLGKRVKPGEPHQKMQGDWDYFKYDIIKEEYSNLLERIEDHTIRTIASFLQNDEGYKSLNLSSYKIVNSNWKKL
jgi:predicted GIY-YIG superfamily endonuclease